MESCAATNQTAKADGFHRAFELALGQERKRLGHSHPFFINSRPCKTPGQTFATQSPADTRIRLGQFQGASREHVRKAVASAKGGYPFWRELGWEQRLAFVRKGAETLAKHQYELAALLCLEVGKTRIDAMGEVRHAIEGMQHHCHEMETHNGYRITRNGHGSEKTYDTLVPYGVWAVVSPFDTPLAAASSMISAAILTGNTVVYKPSSLAPLCGLRLYGLFELAGLPVGVVNCLTGAGAQIGPDLTSHPDIQGLIFAGRRSAAREMQQQFQRDLPRPCLMETGGNNPAIVMPSANLEDATEGIVQSAFTMGGQKGCACSRVYVHQDISRDFLEALVARTQSLKVGNPADRETFLGPLIDGQAIETFKRAVAAGKKDGRVLLGGQVLVSGDLIYGHYAEPTLVSQVRKESKLFTEEFPVPVLAVTEVKSLEEAITQANASPYGASAGFYSQVDGERELFFDRIEAACAYSNRRDGATSGGRPGMPAFGGWKASGSTGKNASGPYFVTQFMREQSRTVCW